MTEALSVPPSDAARLDMEAVRTVVIVAETGAVNRAAARLGRTPAAVSMQLRKLEDTLGCRLFARTRSGMLPTPAGERLLPHARRMVAAERAAREAFTGPTLSGRVRVGLIEDVGGVQLSEVLASFATAYKDVIVEVTVASSAALGHMLDDGGLDLAVLAPGAAVPWRPEDRVIHEEPLVWAAAREGTAWSRRPVPLAVAGDGCAWRRATVAALEAAGIAHRITLRSDAYEAMIAAVLADLAVAPLPRSRVPRGLRILGAADGAPPLGRARTALRLGSEVEEAAVALAERVAASFGRA